MGVAYFVSAVSKTLSELLLNTEASFLFCFVLGAKLWTLHNELHPQPILKSFCNYLTKSVKCPGWAGTCSPPDSASQNAGIAGMHHHTQSEAWFSD